LAFRFNFTGHIIDFFTAKKRRGEEKKSPPFLHFFTAKKRRGEEKKSPPFLRFFAVKRVRLSAG
jgi:hypothetical protein